MLEKRLETGNATQTRGIEISGARLIDFLTNCINNAAVSLRARACARESKREREGVCTGWPQENEHGKSVE